MAPGWTSGENSGMLGMGQGMSLAAATNVDQPITLNLHGATRWIPRRIVACNRSVTPGALTAGGVFTGTGKTGITLVSGLQLWSALSGVGKLLELVLASTDVLTATTVYLSMGIPNGSPCTVDLLIYGDIIPN